ncbi:MAG: DNA replication/repair protein RecF [Defluviitaleaceae bacterium]|nr:DNA replication/repair protein RecF [Defluviitaleaceae bacterium]
MYLSSISVENIRNLTKKTLNLSNGINVLYGKNAQGKTNLLEAVYFAAMGRSHRTNIYKELIAFGKREAFISCEIKGEFADSTINVRIQKEKKEIAVNGNVIKKLVELFGTMLIVIFSPEDLELVTAGPRVRRKFIDLNLCQIHPLYYHQLNKYHHILNQRNNLLKDIKKNKQSSETIFLWDSQLVECGIKIIDYRAKYINSLNDIAKNFHNKLTDNKENLKIIYRPNTDTDNYGQLMESSLDRDIYLGSTSVGIHKDDMGISVNNIDVRSYGSQGQKRSVSLSLKLSGIEYIKNKESPPIVLLDDVLSELDESRQMFLLKEIQGLQTILTCTGVEDVLVRIGDNVNIAKYEVKEGVINGKY